MLRAIRVVRPATRALRTNVRTISSTPRRLADDHHGPPQIFGPGLKDKDSIPSDEEQATGLERFQLLGRMEGVDVFDMTPLDTSRLGTLADPIKVPSLVRCSYLLVQIRVIERLVYCIQFNERIIGCTGVPADSHETLWLPLNAERKNHRCPECGSGEFCVLG